MGRLREQIEARYEQGAEVDPNAGRASAAAVASGRISIGLNTDDIR